MNLIDKYVESVLAFSIKAFKEAYRQGLQANENTPEWELTRRTYKTVKYLEKGGHFIDLVIVRAGQIVLLYGENSYVVIQ